MQFYNTVNVKNMHLHRDSNPGFIQLGFIQTVLKLLNTNRFVKSISVQFYNTVNVKNMHLHRDSNPGFIQLGFIQTVLKLLNTNRFVKSMAVLWQFFFWC